MMPDLNYILGEGHQINMKHDAIYLRFSYRVSNEID
jgi:hypothetical protein